MADTSRVSPTLKGEGAASGKATPSNPMRLATPIEDTESGAGAQRYPLRAGHKGDPNGPGAEGAEAVTPSLGRRQQEALEALGRLPGQRGTAEDVAALIGRHWFHVRPRLSECKALGRVVIEPDRGVTGFGKPCTIYRVATADELSLFAARKAAEAEKTGEADHG